MPGTIDQLIVCSPYEEPDRHWRYERESRTFSLEEGRRPAGYVVATPGSKSFDDPGVFKELPLVNRIRPRVRAWREAGYPGVTGTTARLLQHWRDPELFEARRFFFCQLEAIETLIWLTEAPAGDRQGFEVPGDGGPFARQCAKMATGSGKTLVMAMAIAWHILNRIANPQDPRFSRHVLVIAPGLTVRKRLAVLEASDPGNYYERFDMVPAALRERLRQGQVLVRNRPSGPPCTNGYMPSRSTAASAAGPGACPSHRPTSWTLSPPPRERRITPMENVGVQARKLKRVEYDRLVEAEVFGPEDRIELLGGRMIFKEPQYSPHATAITLVHRALTAAFGPGWCVRAQLPVALDDESEPEPDVSVVPGDPRDYRDAHPERPVLLVEVALSRLRFDREHKGSLYARARVAEYWIVNIPDRRLEVYRNPIPDAAAPFGARYGFAINLGPDDRVSPLALPAASIMIGDLLP